MIGVVVWSNTSREQAVIWCDDHAALAYLAGRNDFATGSAWPQPGAILELETETIGEIRYARNVHELDDAPRSTLPQLLKRERATHLSLVHDADTLPLQRCVGA